MKPPPPPTATHELDALAVEFRARIAPAREQAQLAASLLGIAVAVLVARAGTGPMRGLAGLVLVALTVGLLAWGRKERSRWVDPSRTIDALARPVDAARASRAIRALSLLGDGHRDASEGTSRDLAELHVTRTLRSLPRVGILERAARIGARYAQVAVVFGLAFVGLIVARGFSLVEGLDVLVAGRSEAVLAMNWLDDVDLVSRPPEYLHEHERMLSAESGAAVPHGTWLTLRGVPLHAGRALELRFGDASVPFADDGTGRLVARVEVKRTAALQVVARFGDVVIPEPRSTPIRSIEDLAPRVELEGAPRAIRLMDLEASASIPIKYTVSDDHGLREVHLVLRSGTREERRVLAKLDGETDTTRGGQTLRARDPFLKRSHAPIEVRVEAEDNDAVTGPKWGASSPITLIPPEAGEPESLRLAALRQLRDALVDSLASRLARVFPAAPSQREALAADDAREVATDAAKIDEVTGASYAGVRVGRRLTAMLHGQMRRVREALTAEVRAPGSSSHGRLVAATERLVLVSDAIVRGLAQKDAQSTARLLADVADDLVLGTAQMRRSLERERGTSRADAAVVVLAGGGRSLAKLGSLGRDLGEIIEMDVGRVARAREADDAVHAEIAASDLAARLRDPSPSFGGGGGSGGRAGSDASGAGGGGKGEGDDDDEAAQAFGEAASDLDQLASDHARQMDQATRELEGADAEEMRPGDEQLRAHARAVRDATRPLPSVGAGSDSWTNKGASAREHAEAMARSLEQGDVGEAVASGRSALDALEEAKHVSQRERWGLFSAEGPEVDRGAADEKLDKARGRLEPELRWATEQLAEQRKKGALRRATDATHFGEKEQRMAERAAALRKRGEDAQGLPGPALDALSHAEQAAEDAAQALRRGDVSRGLMRQREAQQGLEAAREAVGGDPSDDSGSDGSRGLSRERTAIPAAGAHKGPEEFRRRVLEGLATGAASGQREAIRRYAEGLLR